MPKRPARKREKNGDAQPQLPSPEAATQSSMRVLPMQLRAGDRLTDETSEYEVIGQPYTTGGGKTAKSGASRTSRSR